MYVLEWQTVHVVVLKQPNFTNLCLNLIYESNGHFSHIHHKIKKKIGDDLAVVFVLYHIILLIENVYHDFYHHTMNQNASWPQWMFQHLFITPHH